MASPLPSLNALRAFEAAARHGSMSLAAEELHVSAGAVSQQIRELERDLGGPLFHRRPRQISLTETGAQLFPALRSAFRILREASDQARARPGTAVLTVSCTAGFASQWLLPRLAGFERLHPGIDLRISASNRILDFGQDRIDLAVRHGLGRWPGLRAERLVDDELTPVCSPGYLRRNGPLAGPGDLSRARLLHDEHRHDWALWLIAAGAPDDCAAAGPVFVDGTGAIEAAKAERGIALVRRSMVAQDLADGRLVAPFGQGVRSDLAYYLAYPPDALDKAHVAAFRDWLLAEAAR
ncbi:transcriptional regulator GcvA [Frigidibacter mobilis]|uniref:Transcriptional regulator protein n=1 Tax=Frigidibacter mobilis TaxID=1335048 RepID=A0A159Z301_9RHOB|nr:transcriptional regulator GcvA [Frigidibacter mobilis]AMY69452.1 transcriptional regulator protein [Frigidibacter mobilis]